MPEPFLSIRVMPETRKTLRTLREIVRKGGRLDRFKQTFACQLAEKLRDEVRERLGTADPSARALGEALRILGVGEERDHATVGVFARPSPRQIEAIERSATWLIVHARRLGTKIDPVAAFLATESPWTFDTLPVDPAPSVAWIESQRVPRVDAEAVATHKRARAAKIRERLVALGAGAFREPRTPLRTAPVESRSLLALRGEEGILEGIRPAWRKAIRETVADATGRVDEAAKMVFDPKVRPIGRATTRDRAGQEDLRAAGSFQDRIQK